MKALIQTVNQSEKSNSQTNQELKNATMANNRDIQELKNATSRDIQELKSYVANIEWQVGQLANQVGKRERGKFLSQPVHPKEQFGIRSSSTSNHGQEHVKAITTLRSGKQGDNKVATPEEASDIAKEEENQAKSTADVGLDTVIPSVEDQSKKYVPKAPYPDKLIAPKKSSKYDDILEVFKHVQINIPFLDAIQQVPSHAKFLKDLVTVKRKKNVPKKAFLTKQ